MMHQPVDYEDARFYSTESLLGTRRGDGARGRDLLDPIGSPRLPVS
jgi:hypothetical protein